jgi:hypothetical protein
MKTSVVLLFFFLGLTSRYVSSFKSDELPEDDEEWGFVGRETGSTFGGGRGERVAQGSSSNEGDKRRSGSTTAAPTSPAVDASGDKKIQFDLEHSFGDSEFTPAGSFSARLRASTHGRQVCFPFRPIFCQHTMALDCVILSFSSVSCYGYDGLESLMLS